ncbi:peptide ABC transporter substrate-binding protein [Teichococcus vastitatis]|uniref:Peptide ABC transporter substrate-binding protein n=1 Tax=Teichococcus vastitatis TaxID=2307076 RepID=A0ABS9W047_9PROT|nr:peptide ABC transporter substrate-binding protein [Pseudoroseomonas vastitatis]MCI0752654.1 peptide ABC transporter substrate-binding protein [Pseudoroseomonas vastitatis]
MRHLLAVLLALLLFTLPAAAQAPRDSLVIGLSQYPSNFHPNIENMAAKAYILGFALHPVTAYDAEWKQSCIACTRLPSLENGDAVLETTPDGKPGIRVTWQLRPDWKWGDGTPVTPEDFRFAWEAGRAFETGLGPAEFYRSAYRFESASPHSITLHFDKVTFDYAGLGQFQPLPARIERPIWEADRANYRTRSAYETDTTNAALYNGPYRIAAVQPGAGVTLERNPHWGGPAPAFNRIQLRTVENNAALEAQLLAGQIDMVAGELGLPLEQATALQRRTGGRFRFHYNPGLTYEHIDLNLENPVLADRRVRQALLHAADRAQIVARLFGGQQEVAHGGVHPRDAGFDPGIPQYPFDPARARALLDEAGWTSGAGGLRRNAAGETLSFDFMTTAGNRTREQVQQILAGMWKTIGVDARIRNEPPRVFFAETVSKRRYGGAAMFAWVSSPENVPRTILHSDEIATAARNWSGQNYTGYKDAEVDRLIEALPLELDANKRRPLWAGLQRRVATDLPSLPLWHRSDAHVWPQWLDGVTPTGHQNYSSLWVTQWRVR